MKPFSQGEDWLKYWTENQKSLFQAWVEGKPPPFAVQGEPPPGAEPVTDLIQRSMESLNDGKGEPITSGRQMLDLWLANANAALVEMHRSKEFLEAQRRMTRSSTEYRLAERDIAEAFCEAHHIPTRTEVDEMQK